MTTTQVLVVGAGPTGLALAAMLGRAGVAVKIIDANAARSDKSKALGVQAGTLEALEDVFGPDLPRRMVDRGRPARSASVHLDGRAPLSVNLGTIPSPYNFILILEQSETERFLEEQLATYSLRVERGHELVAMTDQTCTVKKADGEWESLRADYVVGCDGAHSTVRKQLGLPFHGGAYTGNFILGDVHVDWPWDCASVHNFVSRRGTMACFPMRGEKRYRLILIPKTDARSGQLDIALEEFAAIAESLAGRPLHLNRPEWLTRFRVHHRIVNRLRRGNAFLAGDAAHIHSPAGGQGMNTGIQDALFLGAKLIQVLRHSHDPAILNDYEKERLPVARRVLRNTDLFSRLALLSDGPLTNAFRAAILPKLVKSPFIQKKMALGLSEVRISRRERPVRLGAFEGGPRVASVGL